VIGPRAQGRATGVTDFLIGAKKLDPMGRGLGQMSPRTHAVPFRQRGRSSPRKIGGQPILRPEGERLYLRTNSGSREKRRKRVEALQSGVGSRLDRETLWAKRKREARKQGVSI